MAIQFGTVDGLVNITKDSIFCFVKGIDEFVRQGGPAYAKLKEISFGTAFQRFVDPVYNDKVKLAHGRGTWPHRRRPVPHARLHCTGATSTIRRNTINCNTTS